MKRVSRTQVASVIAMVVAILVVVLFPSLPPLERVVHSEPWTKLGEWFGVTLLLLLLISWADLSDKEFDIGGSGVKGRRVKAQRPFEELQAENQRARQLVSAVRTEVEKLEEAKRSLQLPAAKDDVQ